MRISELDSLWFTLSWALDWGLVSADRLECVWPAQDTWLEDLWRENWAFYHKWFSERLCRTVWQVYGLSTKSKHCFTDDCVTDKWSHQLVSHLVPWLKERKRPKESACFLATDELIKELKKRVSVYMPVCMCVWLCLCNVCMHPWTCVSLHTLAPRHWSDSA